MSIISFKVVLLGNTGVGKTSLAYRIKFNSFNSNTDSTVGCEFFAYTHIFSDESKVKFLIWDTSGQEVFKTFTPQFCRNASLGLIMYDMTLVNDTLIESLKTWINFTPQDCIILIVPTKQDIPIINNSSKMNKESFSDISREIHFAQPTSSKMNIGFPELLDKIGCLLLPLSKKMEVNSVEIEKGVEPRICCST